MYGKSVGVVICTCYVNKSSFCGLNDSFKG